MQESLSIEEIEELKMQPGNIIFSTGASPGVLVIRNNGDFFVRGRRVVNDFEVYTALKDWIKESNNL